jgi:2-amino-4-hydroxy-6-hydroxymethyldihydropteridine diphosphokinase
LEDVFIGFGSNLQDPKARLCEALSWLLALDSVSLVALSSLYRSEPVGLEDQPWFFNGVAWVRSELGARQILGFLQRIENRMGRVRSVPMGPRIIDLDLLLVGQRVIQEHGLQVPHPRMHLRRFVLEPMAEICPWVCHPVLGKTAKELLLELEDTKAVEMVGPWEVPGC